MSSFDIQRNVDENAYLFLTNNYNNANFSSNNSIFEVWDRDSSLLLKQRKKEWEQNAMRLKKQEGGGAGGGGGGGLTTPFSSSSSTAQQQEYRVVSAKVFLTSLNLVGLYLLYMLMVTNNK